MTFIFIVLAACLFGHWQDRYSAGLFMFFALGVVIGTLEDLKTKRALGDGEGKDEA